MKRSRIWLSIAFVWLALIGAFFFWQIAVYRGLSEAVAEWEYSAFGRAFPVLSYGLLLLLFGAPSFFILSRIHRRSAQRRKRNAQLWRTATTARSATRAERRVFRVLCGLAGTAVTVGLIALIATIALPGDRVRPQTGDGRALSTDAAGTTTLKGVLLYRRTATFRQKALFFSHIVQFAPMAASADDQNLKYFVEVTPDDLDHLHGSAAPIAFAGTLRRNALPGPIVNLYQYAGFTVAEPNYVLFTSSQSMRWPYYSVAINSIVAALLIAVLALLQRKRLHKVRDLHAKMRIDPTTTSGEPVVNHIA